MLNGEFLYLFDNLFKKVIEEHYGFINVNK